MSLYGDFDQSSLPSIPSPPTKTMIGALPLTAIVVVALLCNTTTGLPLAVADGTVGIKFLLTVDDTWDPNGCIATAATPMLISGRKYNESEAVQVGSCDHGPLEFVVLNSSYDGESQMEVSITFHSSLIEHVSLPTCNIPWNGSYLNPITQDPRESPLPSCWTADSREGYHMTYYWFRLLEWEFFH